MSDSHYLLHGFALQVYFGGMSRVLGVVPTNSLALGSLIPAFLFTLLPTAALYLWVERPFSLCTRRSHRGAARPAPPNARV